MNKNITNISGTKDDVEKQTTDVDETKYIGEEKVVEEERKSVAELKEIFAQDKRDRQYERQPRPFSDKETPPQSADDVTQRATTTIDDDTTTTQEVRRIMSIPISDIPDRLKDDDTSRIIPSPSDTLAPHMASEADQRRDSELFQGVSEELVRLETTYKVTPAEEAYIVKV
uniref:Uncharacterized protein n=1 Tax=Timema douglasi TaxID=61478 RepID=A0A7R8VE28_TIMDO|nr:unnamed protein product [Timema douglasi]